MALGTWQASGCTFLEGLLGIPSSRPAEYCSGSAQGRASAGPGGRKTWRKSGVSKKTRLFSSIPSLEEGRRKLASTCVILAHVRFGLRPSTSRLVRVCLPHLAFAAPRRARLNQHIQTSFSPFSISPSLHCAALDYTSTYRHLLAPASSFCCPALRPEPHA